MAMQQIPGSSSISVRMRPFNKGMFRDRSSQTIPEGGAYTLKEAIVDPQGVYRRPGYGVAFASDYYNDTYSTTTRAVGLATTWNSQNPTTILITDEFAFEADYYTGFTLIPDTGETGYLSTGQATASGTTVTKEAAADDWTSTTELDLVQPGDVIFFDGVYRKITAVNSASELVVDAAFPNDPVSVAENFEIYRSYKVNDIEVVREMPDWAFPAPDRIVVVTPQHQVSEIFLDGSAWKQQPLQGSTGSATIDGKYFTAGATAFYNERLWFGDITSWNDSAGNFQRYRQRVWYSSATNVGNTEIADGGGFIDLTYTPGKIQRILPLGNLLAVYLEDQIYLGQPGNYQNFPVIFDKVETGNVGLVGPRAIASYLEGHFFVGQDNIYYHTNGQISAIGTPVLRDTLRRCAQPWRIIAEHDPLRRRIVFGFPGESGYQIQRTWSFNYETQAWSYEEYDTWFLGVALVDSSTTWDSLTGTWDAATTLASSWDQLGQTSISLNRLYRDTEDANGRYLNVASDNNGNDLATTGIPFEVVSMDHDYGLPDINKTWTRIAIKLEFQDDTPFLTDLDFTCEVSNNRGKDWKSIGILKIPAGRDEGHVDFRMVSSHMRFRIQNSDEFVPYWITEYTVKATVRGHEGHIKSQE